MKLITVLMLIVIAAGCQSSRRCAPAANHDLCPDYVVAAAVARAPGYGDDPDDSITRIFNSVIADSFPVEVPPFEVILRLVFTGGESRHTASVDVIDARTGQLLGTSGEGSFVAEAPPAGTSLRTHTIRFNLPGVRAGEPALWHAIVKLDGATVAVVPIELSGGRNK